MDKPAVPSPYTAYCCFCHIELRNGNEHGKACPILKAKQLLADLKKAGVF